MKFEIGTKIKGYGGIECIITDFNEGFYTITWEDGSTEYYTESQLEWLILNGSFIIDTEIDTEIDNVNYFDDYFNDDLFTI